MSADAFAAFYEAAHDTPPFPWQVRLAEQVLAEGRWPGLLALPTGAGKTSAVDIALWALARAPHRHPRRVVMVVDRRVVVDQGADHARALLDRLSTARGGVLREVADRLRSTWNAPADAPPFHVAVLRGGMPRDDAWARRPDQPVLAFSTVDQVGSRLLFRGYGVSERMASVHAGLLGHDCLLLLDEVHLSRPFAETLLALRDRWRRFAAAPLPDRWGMVLLSATPGLSDGSDRRFELDADDLAHPVLARRLRASKPARLEEVAVAGDEARRCQTFVDAVARAARKHREEGARVVAVVVNRVDTAREVYRVLAAEGESVLLTGRMRPLDRDASVSAIWSRVRCGRIRSADDAPLYVVATQSLEAGADLDVDALVTECASLDALRQRFGRLDRRGDLGLAYGTILVRADALREGDDPVYGGALAATWRWLQTLEPLDFGVLALPAEKAPPATRPEPVHAPVLLPAHLDAWSQTHPRPEPEPEPALWLHGPARSDAEVTLVWRADLDDAALEAAVDDPRALIQRLDACPPGSPEALAVPIGAARRWLAGEGASPVADAPAAEGVDLAGRGRPTRLALRWAGDGSKVVDARSLRPGDTLVVPSTRGGITAGNWDPSAVDPVPDWGDRVQLDLRGRPTLRLDARVHPDGPEPPHDVEAEDFEERLDAWLAALPADDTLSVLRRPRERRLVRLDDGGLVLVARRRQAGRAAEVTTEDDRASFTGRAVTLARHLADVGDWAERFARALAWPEALVADVVLAARLHDLGKADPRFQRLLHGGSEVRAALYDEPLAKSSLPALDGAARRVAQERSGYPQGARHELLSVALAEGNPGLLQGAHDRDLVLHLIGSHHGWCRPFAPAVVDEAPVDVEVEIDGRRVVGRSDHPLGRLDSGVTDRFWALTERYGWWGLAWIEAVMRLADHRASEAEEQG